MGWDNVEEAVDVGVVSVEAWFDERAELGVRCWEGGLAYASPYLEEDAWPVSALFCFLLDLLLLVWGWELQVCPFVVPAPCAEHDVAGSLQPGIHGVHLERQLPPNS